MKAFCLLLCLVQMKYSYGQLTAAFTANNLTGCSPLVVQFTDASTGNPSKWKWDLGNGAISSQQNPSAVYINPGTYTIKLWVSNGSGTDSLVKLNYLTVYAKPTVQFSASPTSGCIPLPVQFTDQSSPGSGTITSETWDFGDGQIQAGTNPRHVYTVSDTFSVTLSVTNSYGCSQTFQIPQIVDISPAVVANFNYNYTNACQPPTLVNFTNTSASKSPLTYQWLFGDGGTATQANPSYTYNQNGNYTVSLVATSNLGCTDTVTKSLSIGIVKPDFTLPGGCINEPLSFVNTSSPVPASASWTFGDGGTSTKINGTHTYTTPGTYAVQLTANFGACTSTATKNFVVLDKPAAAFSTASPLGTCSAPATVQFTNNTVGGVNYKWLFGDGGTSGAVNPSHTYTKLGFYTVTLIAFNSNGCSDTLTLKNFIKLGPPVITGFPGTPFKGCAPKLISPRASIVTGDSIVSYNWDFGDGTTSTSATPSHLYTSPGLYTLTLTVVSAGGCTTTYTKVDAVTLGVKPHADFSALPTRVCGDSAVNFQDQSTGNITTWDWYFTGSGDSADSHQQNPVHSYNDTGYFNVKLVVGDNGCFDSITKPRYIYVDPPVAKFQVAALCSAPYDRNFTDSSIGAQTWNWDFGDGTTSTLQDPQHTYASSGSYTVQLEVTHNTCKNIHTISVQVVDEKPAFTYTPNMANLCKNDSVTFAATGFTPGNIKNFFWNFGDSSSSSNAAGNDTITHYYKKSGSFAPILVTTDINGCRDTVTNGPVKITVSSPVAGFSNPGGVCLNGTVTFTDLSKADSSFSITKWIWNFGDGTIDTLSAGPFTHTYDSVGYYKLSLLVFDSNGCVDSLSKKGFQVTQPKAAFTVSDSVRCSNNAVFFNNTSSGNSLSYLWDFGNGKTSTAASPNQAYTTTGTYSVNLLVKDKFGCVDSMNKPNFITISNPKASFTLSDTFATCPPLIIKPLNTSTDFNSVEWNFADGNSTNLQNPTHYYTIAGNYNLMLIARGHGACYDTATREIVLKGPSGTLHYTAIKGCAPTTVTFSATTKNVVGYIWDFNNGVTQSTTDSSNTYTYDSSGNFLPRLVLIDSAGCKVSIINNDTLSIADLKVSAGYQYTPGCDTSQVYFKDTTHAFNDNISQFSWDFGDGTTAGTSHPVHGYSASGNYPARLIVGTSFGCLDTVPVPVTVVVHKSPQVSVTAPDSVCLGSLVAFNAAELTRDTAALTWLWNYGNGVTAGTQQTSYSYPATGVYYAGVLVTDANGCRDTAGQTVKVVGVPNLNAGLDTAICRGATIQLRASGANSYLWSGDQTLSCNNCATPKVSPDTSTTYQVTGLLSMGCNALDSVTVKVIQPEKISVSAADTLCLGDNVRLHAQGAESYQWYPSNYLDNPQSDQPLFTAAVDTSLVYTVVGSDSRNCFSDTGKVAVKVYPIPQTQILQPNITLNVGSSVQLQQKSSPDVTQWRWSPQDGLDNAAAESPIASPRSTTTYTCVATNGGSCTSRDQVTVTVLCNNSNIFIPNTFSPNNDGMNDYFYPRGKGLFSIKSMMVFNRWGQIVFQQSNFGANDPNVGWDGTFQGQKMPSDVYVYVMQIMCENNTVYIVKGNVTLLR